MSDLLSAQSLLLAAITALLALWSDTLEGAASHPKPTGIDYQDYEKAHQRIKNTLWFRAVPLFLYAALLSAILAPASWEIISGVVQAMRGKPSRASFDAVAATLVLVHLGLILLAVHLFGVARRIFLKHRAFSKLQSRAVA